MAVAAELPAAMPIDPDQDILDLMEAGRANEAVKLMADRHGTRIYRHVTAELRNPSQADDVSARVFIEAHRDFAQFSRKSTLLAWLYAIARNRIKDALKSRKKSEARYASIDDVDPPDSASSPGDRLDDARVQKALSRCIDKLPTKIREAVGLRYQGFSYEEIAGMLSERAGTIQARVTRAFPLLRECIEKQAGKRV